MNFAHYNTRAARIRPKLSKTHSGLLNHVVATIFVGFTLSAASAVAFSQNPSRIASLSLASDEILLDLLPSCGGISRIAALSTFADDPESSSVVDAAKGIKERVHSEPESLIRLSPDLVIAASFNRPELLRMIRSRKISMITLEQFSSVQDISDHIVKIGEVTGCSKGAEALKATFLKRINSSYTKTLKIYRVINYSPDLTVMGKKTLFDELIRLGGAVNAVAERGLTHWPRIDSETLLAINPDKIIILGKDDPKLRQAIKSHAAWGRLPAVKNDQFMFLNSKSALSTSHYFANAVEEFRKKISE